MKWGIAFGVLSKTHPFQRDELLKVMQTTMTLTGAFKQKSVLVLCNLVV